MLKKEKDAQMSKLREKIVCTTAVRKNPTATRKREREQREVTLNPDLFD